MNTARILIDLFFLGLLIVVGFHLVRQYRKATGSTWERLLTAGKESATILWGKFCMLLSGLIASLDSVAEFFNVPELKTYIEMALGNPKVVAGIMLVLSAVSIYARRRTL
jgi:hypothetical protein